MEDVMRKSAFFAFALACLAATPAIALSDKPYITATDVDFPTLLPPPPAENSALGKLDLDALLALQKNMTPQRMAAIEADTVQNVYQVAGPVLGAKFTKENFPLAGAF